MDATSSTSASEDRPASARQVALVLVTLAISLAAFDQMAGWALNWIFDRSSFNPVAHVRRAKPETLILGSSGGHYAFDPQVLGGNTFNASKDGQGGFYVAAMLNALPADTGLKRVIYAVDPYDIADGLKGPNIKNLAQYTPWLARDPVLREWLTFNRPLEEYKLLSGLYRYRGLITKVVRTWLRGQWNERGFSPLTATMEERPFPQIAALPASMPDASGLAMLRQIASATRRLDAALIVVVSPTYGYDRALLTENRRLLEVLREVFAETRFCDLTRMDDPEYQAIWQNHTYFADGAHMNAEGSKAYSALVKERIAQRCNY